MATDRADSVCAPIRQAPISRSGINPARLVCRGSALGCSGQCQRGRAIVRTVSLIFPDKNWLRFVNSDAHAKLGPALRRTSLDYGTQFPLPNRVAIWMSSQQGGPETPALPRVQRAWVHKWDQPGCASARLVVRPTNQLGIERAHLTNTQNTLYFKVIVVFNP